MQTPSIQFGYFPTPTVGRYPDLVRQVQLAEALGLDVIGVQDHPYQRRFYDTWTLIAALAVQTERIRFFPDVANLPLRPPAMLAKAVASLDEMTGGRIDLGLGAGFFWDGIAALGGPRLEPGEAVDAVEEAIHVCRQMWREDEPARFEGEIYRLRGAQPGPMPAHPIKIHLGAIQSRMLGLTGRLCDGWVPSSPYVPPNDLLDKHAQIDDAAQAAGRDPVDIRRIYNVMGRITDGETGDFLVGPVDRWVDALTELVLEKRMDTLILAPGSPDERELRRFGEEVVPRVKENLTGA